MLVIKSNPCYTFCLSLKFFLGVKYQLIPSQSPSQQFWWQFKVYFEELAKASSKLKSVVKANSKPTSVACQSQSQIKVSGLPSSLAVTFKQFQMVFQEIRVDY